jgi:hypothetical protein
LKYDFTKSFFNNLFEKLILITFDPTLLCQFEDPLGDELATQKIQEDEEPNVKEFVSIQQLPLLLSL